MPDDIAAQTTPATPHVDESLVTYTNVIYALHSLAVVIGITTFHTIVGSFIWSLPSIIAVIMNYARRYARGAPISSRTFAGRSAPSGTR